MSAALRGVLLFVRDTKVASRFYAEGLELPLKYCDSMVAELDADNVSITLRAANGNEALLSTGYSPFLNFVVKDFDTTLTRIMQLGAFMDGPVLYPLSGKCQFAAIRSPDGQMIGLHEPATT